MTVPVLASSNGLLEVAPSVVQALAVLALVALITAREGLRVRNPVSSAIAQLDTAVRLLAPVVVLVLSWRLLIILQ